MSCLECSYFDEDKELCEYCGPATRPPARVIVNGCPAFTHIPPNLAARYNIPETVETDDIPF